MNSKIYRPLIILITMLTSLAQAQGIERKHYNSWESDVGYTQVVRAGHTIYLSGITSEKETFDAQLEDIYQQIVAILADYQLTTGDIVK